MTLAQLALPSCLVAALLGIGAGVTPARARAEDWHWLRSENRSVREGNERFAAGDTKAAISAYDRAARELPAEGGVHLDRGLALLKSGQIAPAREAFRLANQPSAAPGVRADASYDLGLTFYREADELAGQNKHDEAQKLFREASDAFRGALRARPGDKNAAWNYELAKRRIREQDEKQKQEQEQKKQDEKNDDKKDGDEKQDQQPSDKPQDQAQNDPSKPQDEGQKKPEQKPGEQQQPKPGEQQAQNQPKPEPGKHDKPAGQPEPQPAAGDEVKPEVTRALDALEDGEQNLERVRALNRASRERRRPEKDW